MVKGVKPTRLKKTQIGNFNLFLPPLPQRLDRDQNTSDGIRIMIIFKLQKKNLNLDSLFRETHGLSE